MNQSLDNFFDQNVIGAELLKSKIATQLRNTHRGIQDDISKLDKEVVWQVSSLLNLLNKLHETAIDIGDLVIAKVNDSSKTRS